MTNEKYFTILRDKVASQRDAYKDFVGMKTKEKNAEYEVIKIKFNGDFRKEEIEKNNAKYNELIAQAREDAKLNVESCVVAIQEKLKKEMADFNGNDILKLKTYAELPMTSAELDVIIEKYGYSFWNNKFYREIAKKNDLPMPKMTATFDDQMQALNAISDNFDKFIDGYNPEEETYSNELLVSNKTLQNIENTFCNGMPVELNQTQQAMRLYTEIISQSSMNDRAVLLSRALNNTDDFIVKNELLCLIAEKCDNQVIDLAGATQLVDEFKKGDAIAFKNAKTLLDEISKEPANQSDKLKNLELVRDSKNNAHFVKMANEKAKTNRIVRDYLDVVNEAEEKTVFDTGTTETVA